MTVAAVVLAAGGGSRFEGPPHKLLASVRGEPLVVRAVRTALGAGLDETIVVAGAVDLAPALSAAGLAEEVTLVVNERWAEGQATSLAAGIRAADGAGHDAVARRQHAAVAVANLAAGRDHDADVLVPADQRVLEVALVVGAGVLLALAPEGVLVGAADPGQPHADHDRARPRVRDGELADLEHAGRGRHHGAGGGHGRRPSLLGRWGAVLAVRLR